MKILKRVKELEDENRRFKLIQFQGRERVRVPLREWSLHNGGPGSERQASHTNRHEWLYLSEHHKHQPVKSLWTRCPPFLSKVNKPSKISSF
jgi:hypothetical protein